MTTPTEYPTSAHEVADLLEARRHLTVPAEVQDLADRLDVCTPEHVHATGDRIYLDVAINRRDIWNALANSLPDGWTGRAWSKPASSTRRFGSFVWCRIDAPAGSGKSWTAEVFRDLKEAGQAVRDNAHEVPTTAARMAAEFLRGQQPHTEIIPAGDSVFVFDTFRAGTVVKWLDDLPPGTVLTVTPDESTADEPDGWFLVRVDLPADDRPRGPAVPTDRVTLEAYAVRGADRLRFYREFENAAQDAGHGGQVLVVTWSADLEPDAIPENLRLDRVRAVSFRDRN